jgi:ubiquinone/menaquinone biosynthesis C-methylase UbiE
MIERAAAVAHAAGRRPRLVVGDAGRVPFDDASFDSVTCTFGLCCVPDVPAALREALRVLRPGGRLLLADHVVSTHPVLRLAQRCAELVSGPLHGEHLTRRPLLDVRALGLEVREAERGRGGLLELVHAVAP